LKALRLPKAAPDDLRNIIAIQIGQLFPLLPDQLSFDFIQTSDQTVEGFLTVVAAMRADLLRDLRAELKEVGLTPLRILPISLASAIVASRSGFHDALVVEKSENGLALDVIQGGVIRFSRFTGNGSDASIEAKRTLSAAKSGDLPIVSVGSVDIPEAKPSDESSLSLLQEAPHFDFELMEERLRAVKKRVAGRMRLAAVFAFIAVALAVTAYIQRSDATAAATRDQGNWTRKISTLTAIESTDASNTAKIVGVQKALKQAFGPAQPIGDVSSVVDDCLPKGAWLTGVTVERGKPVDVRGTATTPQDVTKFITVLGQSPRFRDVAMVFANNTTIGETPVVQFDVTAVAIGNLPMPIAPKKTSTPVATTTTSTATANQEGAI
jgi:Tfp pilus assembly protein PilN